LAESGPRMVRILVVAWARPRLEWFVEVAHDEIFLKSSTWGP
jgi:hypothetical protein